MKRIKRVTFKQVCNNVSAECAAHLQKRVREANSVAKIAITEKDRLTAYRVKHAALNHGLRVGLFKHRSDENGRNHLLLVGTDIGRVHMPIRKLTSDNRQSLAIRTALGHRSQDAA
jgi:hypothetical protein